MNKMTPGELELSTAKQQPWAKLKADGKWWPMLSGFDILADTYVPAGGKKPFLTQEEAEQYASHIKGISLKFARGE